MEFFSSALHLEKKEPEPAFLTQPASHPDESSSGPLVLRECVLGKSLTGFPLPLRGGCYLWREGVLRNQNEIGQTSRTVRFRRLQIVSLWRKMFFMFPFSGGR